MLSNRKVFLEVRVHNVREEDSNQEIKRRVRELLEAMPYRVTLGKPKGHKRHEN